MIPIRNAVPTRYPPIVTWALIAMNCAVFLLQGGGVEYLPIPRQKEEFKRATGA